MSDSMPPIPDTSQLFRAGDAWTSTEFVHGQSKSFVVYRHEHDAEEMARYLRDHDQDRSADEDYQIVAADPFFAVGYFAEGMLIGRL